METSVQCLKPVAHTFRSEIKTKNPDSIDSSFTFIFQHLPPVAKGTECKIQVMPGHVAVQGFFFFFVSVLDLAVLCSRSNRCKEIRKKPKSYDTVLVYYVL